MKTYTVPTLHTRNSYQYQVDLIIKRRDGKFRILRDELNIDPYSPMMRVSTHGKEERYFFQGVLVFIAVDTRDGFEYELVGREDV